MRVRSMPKTGVVAAVVAIGLAVTASAQTSWLNPVNGTWGTAGNWTAGVPNASLDATLGLVGAYDVTMSASGTSRSLVISNAAARLLFNSGVSYAALGDINNAGVIVVNPTAGATDATISFNSPAITLSGAGSIVLNPTGTSVAVDAGLVSNAATNVVTNAAGHTIRGNGYIFANVDNAGLITCDISGRGISLASNPKSNSGQILAQNGGTVDLNGITLTQTGVGVFRATGTNSVAEASGSIVSGTWEGVAGGLARTGGNLTLDSVTTVGTVHVLSGQSVLVVNSFTNTGTISVNPSGGAGDATISFNSPAITLNGSGAIVLNPTGGGVAADAGLNTNLASNVVTNSAGATIRGNGYINANVANEGLITCDIASRGINLATNAKSNSGEIIAQNGGMVDLNGITLTQSATGVFRATGTGSIVEASGSIIGGAWEGVSGGLARTGGDLTLDGVTIGGDVNGLSGDRISVLNSLNNTGTITINPSGGSFDSVLSFDSPSITLTGNGTIVLNPIGAAAGADAGIISNVATNVVTNPAGATIRGNGYINANVANAGVITCDLPNAAIVLGTNPKSNSGEIVSQNGGSVDLNGVTLSQSVTGVFGAVGANSIAEASGGIVGGTWEGVSGGVARTGGNLALDDVRLRGRVELLSGDALNVSTGLINNAVLKVNPSGGATNATLVVLGNLTIGGTGTILLNGVGSTNDANISGGTNVTLTSGPDHKIAGRGQINVRTILQGTISPGSEDAPVNRIEHTSQTFTMTPTAVYAVDLLGLAAGQYDTLAFSGSGVTLDGTLAVTVADGFVPALGDEFVIMTHGARNGTFEQIVTPNPGLNNAWRVRYEATRTVLTVTCPPDANGDHSVGLDDLAILLSNFGLPSGALGNDGDVDGDTDVDLSDLAALLTIFGSSCL